MSDWMRSLCESKAMPGVQAKMIDCTPRLAEILLGLNTRNRKVAPSVVEKYVTEILNDEWYATAQGVGIDDRGVLLDGQHRLAAIVESGCTVPILIVTGLPPKGQEKVDRQRKRTLYDAFSIAGYTDNRKAVQVATFLARRHGTRVSPSDSEVKETLHVHKNAIDRVTSMMPKNVRGLSAAGTLGALTIGWEKNPRKTEEFIAAIKEPVGLAYDEAPYRFLRWLEKSRLAAYGGAGAERQNFDYRATCYALSAWFDGRRISAIRTKDDVEF